MVCCFLPIVLSKPIVRTLLGIKTDEENEDNRKDAADDEEGMKN